MGQTVDEISTFVPEFREAYALSQKNDAVFCLGYCYQTIDSDIANRLDLVEVDSRVAFGLESERKLLKSSNFEDVDVRWFFWKERIFAYLVSYNGESFGGEGAKAAIKVISDKGVLPPNGWKYTAWYAAELQCVGFKAFVNDGFRTSPHLLFLDTGTVDVIKNLVGELKRRQKSEAEQKRRENAWKP